MKVWVMAAAIGLSLAGSIQAVAKDSGSKAKSAKQSSVTVQQYATTSGRCGVWRDNAMPIRSLTDPCEQDEFWRRIQDHGRDDPRPDRN